MDRLVDITMDQITSKQDIHMRKSVQEVRRQLVHVQNVAKPTKEWREC